MDFDILKKEIATKGFTIIDTVFSENECDIILDIIADADSTKPTFRKSEGLFAIRQFLKELLEVRNFVFTKGLLTTINDLFGQGYFVTKSIYFDKPEQSNWFVAYHQDLTISVKEKIAVDGFGPWTVKHEQFSVQPPLEVLEENFTIRVHLDDTTYENGALKVVVGSHAKGIYRPEAIDWNREEETICEVKKGGIMIMRPLLLHASDRTTNNEKRRVIHIEFGKDKLPDGLQWSEKIEFQEPESAIG